MTVKPPKVIARLWWFLEHLANGSILRLKTRGWIYMEHTNEAELEQEYRHLIDRRVGRRPEFRPYQIVIEWLVIKEEPEVLAPNKREVKAKRKAKRK